MAEGEEKTTKNLDFFETDERNLCTKKNQGIRESIFLSCHAVKYCDRIIHV